MDGSSSELFARVVLAGNDYRERARRHRARDRITNRKDASQSLAKLRRTLGKSFILFSMSMIVEGRALDFQEMLSFLHGSQARLSLLERLGYLSGRSGF